MESSLGRSVTFGPFRLYPVARVIERDGVRLALGSRAFDILLVLIEHAGEVVSHRELMQCVWRGLVVTPGSLRVHVAGLRKALGEGDGARQYIANVPGQGYSFVAPINQADATATSVSAALPQGPAEGVTAPPAPRNNLPNQLTSFIGRDREIRQLKDLLTSTRLLTLTGIGGCGKTRLAVQVVSESLGAFPDGCWLVELSSMDDPGLVVRAVANVLGIEEQGMRSRADAVIERLATERVLLVLDNAEHLVQPCAELADLLLRRCARLKVLVTSREALGVSGELVYRVPSLSIADPDAPSELVSASEAARLFIERARLHRADFAITPKNARTLTSICRRLDGIALAIELAAPRLRTMSIEELSSHLDDRFGILTSGHRTALPRHRTLRSLIDWSYDLLSSAERTMLRRIAVFSGGLMVDSAEFVCAGDSVGHGDALDLLTSLTDKNLLLAEPRGDMTRFRMLETVRQYAWERLRESGEEAMLRSRHFEFFADLADALAAELVEAQRNVKLKRLDFEVDNLRTALAWCDADVARAAGGLRVAGKLVWFWITRGYFSEGRGWIERFLAATQGGAEDEDRAKALATAGALAYHQDDYAPAVAYHQEAIAIYRRLGQRGRAAALLGNLGGLAVNRGDYQEARGLFDEALAAAREAGDRRLVSLWLYNLGVLACTTGDFEQARLVLEECVPISREQGKWSAAGALQQLGWVRHAQGQHEQARSLLMESLDLHREFEDKLGIARTLYYLGMVSHDEGDTVAAKAQLREALTLEQTVGDRILSASTLEALAGLSLSFAGPLDAARLWGAAQCVREEIGAPQELVLRRRCERQIAAARQACGDDAAFDAAWSEGRAMTLEATVRLALNL